MPYRWAPGPSRPRMSSSMRRGPIELGDGALAMGDPQLGEQPWHALVLGLAAFKAGFVSERASDPTLARAARAGDQDIGGTCGPRRSRRG